jgi:hypothetical protein
VVSISIMNISPKKFSFEKNSTSKGAFLTAILLRGLMNWFFFFFFLSVHLLYIFYLDFYLPFPFGLLFSFPIIWTFISLLYLDFYIPLLFGLFLKKSFFFNYFFLFNRSHILDFFQKILLEIIE